mmetsp:Transcript_7383/g.21830  ORF Transcript_7383/g.21830 Transcript_7383/m.21830 type:complete len:256 (+) Transcript_7383:205-972(+)
MPIATLFDDKKDDDDDDDDKQELYTGGNSNRGGGGSGMAVLGPGDEDADPVAKMFAQARAAAARGDGPAEGAAKTTVTVYSNGFVVGDGPFRASDGSPENEAFLRDVGRGLVPRELEERAAQSGAAMNLELVDKRGEAYEPPAYTAFSGGGQTLASEAPAAGAVLGGGGPCDKPVVDDAAPKTTLQIRLANGKRIRATLNLSHTVRQLDAFVRAEDAEAKPYVLLAGFPPAPLADPSQTIEAAGLKGASVTQKLT